MRDVPEAGSERNKINEVIMCVCVCARVCKHVHMGMHVCVYTRAHTCERETEIPGKGYLTNAEEKGKRRQEISHRKGYTKVARECA